MLFDKPLQNAILIKRYKRFLADAMTPDGELITLHCANTGAMTGCATPGDTIWYSTSDNPNRKLPYSWELTCNAKGDFICINTLRANQIVKEAIQQNKITELSGYTSIKTEVRYGTENSRIDLLLQQNEKKTAKADCFIEIKSVTLLDSECGYFPDAVTTRGQKHLRELENVVKQGARGILFYLVMHTGIRQVSPARQIDPAYAELLSRAENNGVEIICYSTNISPLAIELTHCLPFKNS